MKTIEQGKLVPLGDVAEFIRGITFKPEDVIDRVQPEAVDCMRTKNVQETLRQDDVWAVPRSLVKRSDQFLREGDLLISSANSWNLVGKCCWIPKLSRETTFGGFVSALRADTKKIDSRYLYYWFSSPRTQELIRSYGQKTTNISNLNIGRCKNTQLPLPTLKEQRRIAGILDKAEELRAKRRAILDLLDELPQAIFVGMFGDPVSNPMGWPIDTLGNVGALDRGVSKHRPRNAPELLGGAHPLIQTGDVSNSDGYISSFISTYSDLGLSQSKKWPKGTLCITIAANIAKTGILEFDACFPDSVVGFTSGKTGRVEYVRVWLSFLQKTLEDSAPESAQKNINLAILRSLPIPLPDDVLLCEFRDRLQEVRSLKRQLVLSSQASDVLWDALVNASFNGDQAALSSLNTRQERLLASGEVNPLQRLPGVLDGTVDDGTFSQMVEVFGRS
ncbi:MAG: restriction endonuclease subunit S [Fimbriimonas sp.]